jgi:hypothetical protein
LGNPPTHQKCLEKPLHPSAGNNVCVSKKYGPDLISKLNESAVGSLRRPGTNIINYGLFAVIYGTQLSHE